MGCPITNLELGRLLASPETPPFIGLVPIAEERQKAAVTKTRRYLAGDAMRIGDLFNHFPFVSAWCVTHALNEDYGHGGQEIYPHIEKILGVSIRDEAHRINLHKKFC